MAKVEAELGPIDRVVHAAGIMPGAPLLEEDPERTKRVMRVNYEGTVNVVSATLPQMVQRRKGDLVCFGSVAGEALTPRLGAYCASKAAVNAYVEILAKENAGKGVRILLACPPMVNTPLLNQSLDSDGPKSLRQAIDQNMLAKPEDVLDALEASLERGTRSATRSRCRSGCTRCAGSPRRFSGRSSRSRRRRRPEGACTCTRIVHVHAGRARGSCTSTCTRAVHVDEDVDVYADLRVSA